MRMCLSFKIAYCATLIFPLEEALYGHSSLTPNCQHHYCALWGCYQVKPGAFEHECLSRPSDGRDGGRAGGVYSTDTLGKGVHVLGRMEQGSTRFRHATQHGARFET